MIISKWIVRKIGLKPRRVDGEITQVYIFAEAESNLSKVDNYEKNKYFINKEDEIVIHLRNVLLNDMNFLNLDFFDESYCDKISEMFPLYFEVYQTEDGECYLADEENLKTAIRFASRK